MGKIIIVAGVPGAGKSTLLLEAWKRVEKELNYSIVSFGTEMLNLCLEAGLVKDRDEMRNLSPDVQEEMQWRTTKRIAERPENILLDKDKNVKIVDFGLAKMTEHESQLLSLTQNGELMGTPNYMAPEQRERFKEVDQRADIYSLGVVFYEMLTGYLPLGRFPAPSKTVQVDVRVDQPREYDLSVQIFVEAFACELAAELI